MRELTKLFKALSDETRIRILKILMERECCVCELMQALGISQTRASRNLSILEDAGLVRSRRDGLWITHYLDESGMKEYAAEVVELVNKALEGNELAVQDRERLRKTGRVGPQAAWRFERKAKYQQVYGGEQMRIAVASDDGNGLDALISQHFGRCPYYTLVEVEAGEVKEVSVVDNPFYDSHGEPGQVPGFIHSQGAQVIIAGGMGPRAISFFNQFGIETVTGTSGKVSDALNSYLGGGLSGSEPCNEGRESAEDSELLELKERIATLQNELARVRRRLEELSSP
jgi:ArsR family transcriptional regulator